jgi:hypothetical protein
VGFTRSETCHALFTIYKSDGSLLIIIIFYIDDELYVATSEGALDTFKKEIPTRFNVDVQGTSDWYLSARIHQDKQHIVRMDQTIYVRSIVTCYVDGSGLKTINSAHNAILPMDAIPMVEDKAKTIEESKKLQEAYTIVYFASCIGSLI